MKKDFDENDVKKLYEAFIKTCDYIENEIGCGKCPLFNDMCGAVNQTRAKEFGEALKRLKSVLSE